ncbi:hypothetical protein [Peribacillus asahii]|uniref:hypothetical protein n=1 Tax=Peribacillus asahii TaxID=228899 RepID=UPI00207B007A|nr:hypothetical protein [Peribacillus asahii]USK62285.1 hypothetical protein LIT37_24235 [Peribacillus asahii]
MLYSAKSKDRNHVVGEVISFKKATGNTAHYGEGIYLSDRVEVSYTRGGGCVYVIENVDATLVQNTESYNWYLTQIVDYEVTAIKEVSVDEAMKTGWQPKMIDLIKTKRSGFKYYYLKAVS